jgi:hypothetical protein
VPTDKSRIRKGAFLPFEREIPLLFRHDPNQPAGRVEEVRSTDKGLHVRAIVQHPEAKCCPYFSVAATVHGYQICHADDRERFHGLVTCATLDEVSLVPASPANPEARVLYRYRQSPAVEMYDIAKAGFNKVAEIVRVLEAINDEHQRASRAQNSAPQAQAPRVDRRPAPAVRRPATEFTRLVRQIEERHPV